MWRHLPRHPVDDRAPALHKHLEFIQAVIARQAGNSFLIKGWAITVAGAFDGFAIRTLDWRVALVGLFPAFTFWGLDAYFLQQERLFRCLYNAAREPNSHVDAFCMSPNHDLHPLPQPETWLAAFWSSTLRYFHGMILLVGLVVATAGAFHQPTLPKSPSARPSSVVSSPASPASSMPANTQLASPQLIPPSPSHS